MSALASRHAPAGRRVVRVALGFALAAGALGALLAFAGASSIAQVWYFTALVGMQPALGSLILLLIYRMTGGQWGRSLQPFLHAGTRLVPVAWVMLAPLLVLPDRGTSAAARLHAASGALAVYESLPAVVVRYLAIGVFLTLLSCGARRAGSDFRLRWVGPAGFIALVFALHLAAVDWLFALQPGWYSTGFPLIWMGGHAVSGLSAAIVIGMAMGRRADGTGSSGRPEGIDWGNLLLATVLFWSYVSFVHLLIMWMGNLEIEVGWYIERKTPLWGAVIGLIAVFHLFLPLLMLFFRAFKRSSRALGGLALTLVALQALHTGWLIFPSLHPSGVVLAQAAVFAVAALALFFACAARMADQLQEAR